jgi:predicted nucleic acid-binding protein
MKNTLVDTDILVNFLRGKRKAKDFLSMLLEESGIFCSAITVAEIAAGMRPGEEDRTKAFLGQIEVLDVNRDVAEKAGYYKRVARSRNLELDDCLVAATAFVHKAILATGNGKHYPMKDIKVTAVNTD